MNEYQEKQYTEFNTLITIQQYSEKKILSKINRLCFGCSNLKEFPSKPKNIAVILVDEKNIWYMLRNADRGIIVNGSN